ncbi:hypothetical protein ACOZ4Y_08125 [Komagataeibacter rhaeticus]|uniref:hypothetical protein n=1 Tax=Komagataeibacter rhaeticus TaxID=215221 RepID=UPI000B244191|nr:hypothetical protein AA16663_1396 [Komagataeibacter rhaeticus DSM 16663]
MLAASPRQDMGAGGITGRPDTRLILAPRLPRLQFFTIAPLAGLVCLVPQVTLIGWIPAAIRSVHALRP